MMRRIKDLLCPKAYSVSLEAFLSSLGRGKTALMAGMSEALIAGIA
jgi:hypothetical protein